MIAGYERDEQVNDETQARIDAAVVRERAVCVAVFRDAARDIAQANYAAGKIPYAQIAIREEMAVREFEERVRQREQLDRKNPND